LPDHLSDERIAMRGCRLAAVAFGTCLLLACARPAPPAHEAYIWQRAWTPAVSTAVLDQTPVFAGWRVLGLQMTGTQQIATQPDLAALASSATPVRLVVRIEGARLRPAIAALLAALQPQIAHWRAAGVALVGIEIDHDCASAALADYADWLGALRGALPTDLKLSITALPSWLERADLDAVLAAVDESVLQVHAVTRPDRDLFDAAAASRWTRAWAMRAPHAFRVALPAYGVRVSTDAQGAIEAVDAEADIERSGPSGRELRADPQVVASYLRQVSDDVPRQLVGFVWFRLPVAGDRRSWSAQTLAAVIGGQPLTPRFVVESSANDGGSLDLRLRNGGNLDSAPSAVDLPAHCRLGDALGRYRLQATATGSLRLVPEANAWLAAGAVMPIGWVRCDESLPPEWELR
jgi:hypothetical protein